jgi:hypothetical protein
VRRLCRSILALLLAAPSATACPCSDDAGSAVSLVREDERYAMALSWAGRRALGRFDPWGKYRALAADEGELGEELLLRAGLRAPRRWEWLGELGYAAYRAHAAGFRERRTGVGDALFRARYSALDEAMPHVSVPWPAVVLSALVRAPLGSAASGGGTGFGSGGASRGLGAWELGGGLELRRSLTPAFELWLGGEAAYRFEDHALGRARRLGPRVEAALGSRAILAPWLSSTLALRLRSIADVEWAGRSLPGTSERLFSVVLGLAAHDRASRFRSAVTLSLDPPVVSRGATAGAALGVSLGVGFR